jgi:transposase InsO family protein
LLLLKKDNFIKNFFTHLSWRISNILDADFCVEALEEAIDRFGAPEILNTDQGTQFTSNAFTDVLKHHDIRISMDGRGLIQDNMVDGKAPLSLPPRF